MLGWIGWPNLAYSALPQSISQILAKHKLSAKNLGILVKAVDSKKPLLTHNANTAFNPASTIKILTTYAALQLLASDFRWKTEFYIDGALKAGRLQGDLVIKGYGDPYLTEATLTPMLRALRQKGLQSIQGHLVIDNSYFAPIKRQPGAFDSRPFSYYNANPSALMANSQTTRFSLGAQAKTAKTYIEVWPLSPDLRVVNQLRYTKGACRRTRYWPRITQSNNLTTLRFTGRYSPACGQRHIHLAVSDHRALFYGTFRAIWQQLGGQLSGGYREGRRSNKAYLYHSGYGKNLGEIIHLVNKHSNNVMAKQLLLSIAGAKGKQPATMAQGRQIIKDWLISQSIDTKHFYLDNGSGLSRDTRISANTLGQIMQHQWESVWMAEMISSYSILGVDGTAKKRFRHNPDRPPLHLKTGLLDHVRSLAGFYHSDNGRRYIVVILQNDRNVHQLIGTKIQDALIRWIDQRVR